MLDDLFEFLQGAVTPYHAAAIAAAWLDAAGYTRLEEADYWNLEAGKGYYITRNGSSVIAWRVPEHAIGGWRIAASHSDSPCWKIKNEKVENDGCSRLSVEGYGGMIMSTWLGAVGILVYEQGFGFIQLYNGPFWMAMPAVAAILIGGATVNKASIGNVIIGTILYQGVVTMTPTVMSAAFQMDMSEVIRIVVSNGMILYALTRKTERGR